MIARVEPATRRRFVHISPDDIRYGAPRDYWNCPAARALNRYLRPGFQARVAPNRISIHSRRRNWNVYDQQEYDRLADFQRDFDLAPRYFRFHADRLQRRFLLELPAECWQDDAK